MKKIHLIILPLFIYAVSIYPQWKLQNSGTSETLTCVYFVDSLNGWVGTYSDSILRTTNGGAIWSKIPTQTNEKIEKIFFINKEIGWCVTSPYPFWWNKDGIICKSTDGGLTWGKKYQSTTTLKGVYFINQNEGWAVGFSSSYAGQLLYTSDGGETWNPNPSPSTNLVYGANDILFLNSDTGFVTNRTGIVKTIDGGKNWYNIPIDNMNPTDMFNDISFSDAQNGLICTEYSVLLETQNGGGNWVQIYTGIDYPFNAVVNHKPRFWIASDPLIYSSSDSGANWFPQDTIKAGGTSTIYFVNDSLGWFVGSYGTILKTENGGFLDPGCPKIPILKYPADNSQNNYVPVFFEWEELPYSAYDIQVSSDSLFTNCVIFVVSGEN
jgi:photosystem II stability/assembly factor-like uncharacterized protein